MELSGEVPNNGGCPDDVLSGNFLEPNNDGVGINQNSTADQVYIELHTDSFADINLITQL